MKLIIGEFIGTYIMMTLGLGLSVVINYFLYPRLQSRYMTGIYWGASIFIASIVSSTFFGTANFNPIISFVQLVSNQINWFVMLGECIVQIIATWLASATTYRIWTRWLYTLPINLNFFATVPRRIDKKWHNFAWEAGGTLIMVANSQILGVIAGFGFLKTFWSALVMTGIITVIAPITGAALNPVRDLVPRTYFSHILDYSLAQWNYALIPLFGPIAGGVIVIIAKSILNYL